ncbi:polysaccharide biosynthesis/export family protein [Salinarimonas ramus]|uniref:Sugar ABC transporter substrate-binding protein n=1 Tax=Salinarimonas ramus TaxID=690164 RepID=A0A917Q9G2_9HYPH|nr:polysaccharide biosynthesis/export family protein [Salinarimonas ramus]GGK38119.1 sugar ABC transporter substrate-binding protein [Salinarimonas ramus]
MPRPTRLFSLAGLIALLVVLVGAVGPTAASAQPASPPAIGPGDTVRVRVLEWRPASGEAYSWQALDGDYVVGPDGLLSLPLVGGVAVEGRTRAQIGEEIGARLKQRAGLLEAPSAVVEVAEWRPVYVAGAVEAPGAYDYRPQLTVLQAVSLAGGMRRSADALDRFERDAISGRGQLRLVALELDQLAARRARLEAELEGEAQIDFPEGLAERREDPAVARLLREEELIFRSRREALDEEVAANERLQRLLREQVEQLEEQIALKDSQLASLQEETSRVASLVERGLATATRLADLERRVADYEADRGNITRSIIQAQVDINQAERNVIALRANRRREIARELREAQATIEELRERFATASALVREAEVIAPAKMLARERRTAFEPSFSIVRSVDGAPTEIAAEETTPVLPGDTVRARVPLPDIDAVLDDGLASGGPAAAPAQNGASIASTTR